MVNGKIKTIIWIITILFLISTQCNCALINAQTYQDNSETGPDGIITNARDNDNNNNNVTNDSDGDGVNERRQHVDRHQGAVSLPRLIHDGVSERLRSEEPLRGRVTQ